MKENEKVDSRNEKVSDFFPCIQLLSKSDMKLKFLYYGEESANKNFKNLLMNEKKVKKILTHFDIPLLFESSWDQFWWSSPIKERVFEWVKFPLFKQQPFNLQNIKPEFD